MVAGIHCICFEDLWIGRVGFWVSSNSRPRNLKFILHSGHVPSGSEGLGFGFD